jgi:protein-S-isoprenylcysteine O-methyltransferase Ste14
MKADSLRLAGLIALAVVFTAGLTFATVELPRLVDEVLQNTVTTPGWDSHRDATTRLKTDLFMAHYHVRAIGYAAFAALVALIAVGFAGRRTGLAALGAFGVMLPVFAQFAGVMFFLAGLGSLNAVWLPVLDLSYEVQHWGAVIDAPYQAVRWLLGLLGIPAFWPVTLLCIGGGILIFVLGVYAWLAARAQGSGVAESLVYRFSRHPQYLGWILWTYGVYLLLQRVQYPRRSWGIGASLPWLLSTMVIVAVALVEEVRMRRRHGEAYEAYRRGAPFLFPVPRPVARLLVAPFRLLFGRERAERTREAVAVVALYTLLLVGCSAFIRAGGPRGALTHLASPAVRVAAARDLAARAAAAPDHHSRYPLMQRLLAFGEPAVVPFRTLLETGNPEVRVLAAGALGRLRAASTVPALRAALSASDPNLRDRAAEALGAIGATDAVPALVPLLDDPVLHVRVQALRSLAALGAPQTVARAPQFLAHPAAWVRGASVGALGVLGAEEAVAMVAGRLRDASPDVRCEAVVALLRIGSPRGRAALQRAVADEDWEVRVYAAEALKRLRPT